jgi:membrane protein DedA with SNARE-associated domain
MSTARHALQWIEPWLADYGAVAVFVMIFVESFGAPVPGETGVIAAGLLAAEGRLSIGAVYLAVLAGATLGDGAGYLAGRLGGRRLIERFGPRVGLTADRLAAIEDRFTRQGMLVVAMARFLPVLRQLNGVIAGSLAMPAPRFFAAQAAGAVLWTTIYCIGPFLFAEAFGALR